MEEERYPSLPWQGWKIVKKLGRGGYGSVYQAQRNSAGVMEDAAIKVISFPKDKEDIEVDFTGNPAFYRWLRYCQRKKQI